MLTVMPFCKHGIFVIGVDFPMASEGRCHYCRRILRPSMWKRAPNRQHAGSIRAEVGEEMADIIMVCAAVVLRLPLRGR